MNGGHPPLTWIVGRGGLLGGAISKTWQARGGREGQWAPDAAIRWEDEGTATRQLGASITSFLEQADNEQRPWRILWCAGAGVVATGADALARETRVYSGFMAALGDALGLGRPGAAPGSFFLASSAGGVYAGSATRPPFDEESPTGSISPYGAEKIAQEETTRCFARERGIPTLIGRISNLYGSGQDPFKPQGLITQVGSSALRRRPVSIYVPLDTIRDYLFVEDAALLITRAIERLEEESIGLSYPHVVVKVIASEVDSTVATVLAAWRLVLKRSPGVALAANPAGLLQPRRLSFRSRVWPELRVEPTPLPIGVHAVFQDQLRRLQAGELR